METGSRRRFMVMLGFSMLFLRCVRCLLDQKEYLVSPELLPGLTEINDKEFIPEMHAGHIPVEEDEPDEKQYFFWKFHDLSNKGSQSASNSLIFWLNGGPGCSSLDGALLESGPLRIDDNGNAYLNPGSWHTRGDLVFVDQPAGTGFSIVGDSKYDSDLSQVSKHFVKFLKNYLKIFPEDAGKQLVLAGESYAGQYIPFIANEILKYNDKRDEKGETETKRKINLKGLIIGNGWIDPNQQSLSYIPFAVESGLISAQDEFFATLTRQHEKCQNLINSDKTKETFSFDMCENILNKILFYTRRKKDENDAKVPNSEQCVNIYDYRLRDSYPACGSNWPKELPNVSKFLSKPGVMDSLHLDVDKVPNWRECDEKVSSNLKNAKSKPSIQFFPKLLERMQIFLFNGDKDIICNNMGIQNLIDTLNWNGLTGFTDKMEFYEWQYYDQFQNGTTPAGFVKHERNLTFISVYNASHMVPYDKSLISRGIMDIYLKDVELFPGDGKTSDVIVTKDFLIEATIPDEKVQDDNTNDNNENDSKNADDDKKHKNALAEGKFTLVVIVMLISSIVGTVVYYFVRERIRKHIHAILIDPENRPPSTNKSVTWADGLENNGSELELQEPAFQKNKKDRGNNDYTRIPNNDEDSFELDDL